MFLYKIILIPIKFICYFCKISKFQIGTKHLSLSFIYSSKSEQNNLLYDDVPHGYPASLSHFDRSRFELGHRVRSEF
jgi:hypothetical protein